MEKPKQIIVESLTSLLRKCLFSVLSFGPMPKHIAFIMDGNRRYAKCRGIDQGAGYKAGFTALISMLQYCYEMGVKYVTAYAFSIDNFKREPKEVQSLMELMKEKIDELLAEETIVRTYGIRINFWGNLELLSEPVRLSVEKAMANTSGNSGLVLSVCVAYTSTHEIMHAIEASCKNKLNRLNENSTSCCNGDHSVIEDNHDSISVSELEENLYTAGSPELDIIVRTSGETRLSNFLLWQSSFSHLQNPMPLWPEYSLRHLVWSVLEYQKVQPYLEARRKSIKKSI